MTPEDVARIVERPSDGAFGRLLRTADASFDDDEFEPALADVLRAEPALVDRWDHWSGDQRWAPSAYVEGTETGWYDAGRRHVRAHADRAGAVADLIRRTAAWLARGEVTAVDP